MPQRTDSRYQLPIVCGDPWKPNGTAASFTRFVLPFSYVPKRIRGSNGKKTTGYRFEPAPQSVHHRDYFTADTGHVLFQQALWLKLAGGEAKEEAHRTWFTRGTEDDAGAPISKVHHKIGMSAPRLVLFEWNEGKETERKRLDRDRGGDHVSCDLMRIGMLFVDLYFAEGSDAQFRDLLELNERFRHFRMPFSEHRMDMAEMFKDWPISLLDDKKIGDPKPTKSETQGQHQKGWEKLYLRRWLDVLEKIPFVDGDKGKCEWRLFPAHGTLEGSAHWGELLRKQMGQVPHPALFYADSRCWVWSCAVLKDGSHALTKFPSGEDEDDIRDLKSWIEFVNVDGPSLQDGPPSRYKGNWIQDRCYDRWGHCGTCYGFTYHSGVVITHDDPKAPPVWRHFGEHYFFIALLLCYIRAALFRFGMGIYQLSCEARGGEDDQDRFRKSFDDLNWRFTLFTNLYRFPMLSNQQQAIEIYAKLRTAFDIDELFDENQREIDTSHKFLQQREAERQNRLVLTLTVVATFGLAFSLVTGFLGMNLYLTGGETHPAGERVTGWPLFFTVLVIFWLLLLIAIVWAPAVRRGIEWLRCRKEIVTAAAIGAIGVILGWLCWPTLQGMIN